MRFPGLLDGFSALFRLAATPNPSRMTAVPGGPG